MDPQWMIVIIQLLLQSCQMKNTIAMCLISDMDYVQQQRMTKHRKRRIRRHRRLVRSQLLELELLREWLCAAAVGCITFNSQYKMHAHHAIDMESSSLKSYIFYNYFIRYLDDIFQQQNII